MSWLVDLCAASAAVPLGVLAGVWRWRERRRQHLIRCHYGPAMFVFPEPVMTALADQVRWVAAVGAQGQGVSIRRIPGVGAAWIRLELTADGDIHRSAGYVRSVRAARRLTDVPGRGRI
jgi:hypothetical protein